MPKAVLKERAKALKKLGAVFEVSFLSVQEGWSPCSAHSRLFLWSLQFRGSKIHGFVLTVGLRLAAAKASPGSSVSVRRSRRSS